jgi:dihydroxyacetone kinase/dihydroxyacetone kinase-like protein
MEVAVTDSFEAVDLVVLTIAQTAVDNETYFGDLDSVVGDGDFGYSMARGFEQVVEGFADFDRTDIGTFLKRVAVTITGRIGGTSGPIWGTAFIRAGVVAGDRTTLTGDDVVAMLRAAADGIKQRGGAELGEKTLLDALVPATDTLERELAAGTGAADALARMAATARHAADATKEMVAMRGRAAYTGERSRGSVDAGATAVAVMLERISAAWAAKYSEEAS